MIDYTYLFMKKELQEQKKLKKQYEKALRKLERYQGVRLNPCTKKNGTYYYSYRKGEPFQYLGTATNPQVLRIRECRLCQEMIRALEHNIQLMENFIRGYQEAAIPEIIARLPKHYRPEHLLAIELAGSEDEIRQRYLAMKEYKETIPPKHPEHLNVSTFDGVKVRSRAEALLYGQLVSKGFYVIYEYPISLGNGRYIFPDFLLIHPVTGLVILWEHLGLWFHPDYQRKYRQDYITKMDIYNELGFTHGLNLFTSYESPKGLDLERIAKEIKAVYNYEITQCIQELQRMQEERFADITLLKAA